MVVWGRKRKRVYKPGFVSERPACARPFRYGHSSGTTVARRLMQPTRRRGTDRSEAFLRRPCRPIWSCTGWGLPCRPCRQERGELLPRHFTLTGNACAQPAVSFLWHFPSRFRVWPLASILSCGARTFLSLGDSHPRKSGHPTRFFVHPISHGIWWYNVLSRGPGEHRPSLIIELISRLNRAYRRLRLRPTTASLGDNPHGRPISCEVSLPAPLPPEDIAAPFPPLRTDG